jgi:hypothetical protein
MRRAFGLSLIAVLFVLFILGIYLGQYAGDLGYLVAMPAHWADCLGDVPAFVPVLQQSGSDGGYNFAAARDPFFVRNYTACAKPTVAFTLERWLFQILSWLLALGQARFLLISMPLVNLLSIGALCFFCARLLEARGLDQRWALLAALNPGIWQPLRFNLVDLVFSAAGIAALYYFDRRRRWITAIVLMFVMLARGTGIGLVLVLSFLAVINFRSYWEAGLYIFSSLPYYLILKPWLISNSGGLVGNTERFTIPFAVPISQISDFLAGRDLLSVALASATLLFLLISIGISIWHIWKERQLSFEPLLIIGFCLASLSYRSAAWGNAPIQIFRIVSLIFPCLVLLLAPKKTWWAQLILLSIPAFSALGIIWMLIAPRLV